MRQHAFHVFITFVIHLFDVILDKVENDMNTRPEVIRGTHVDTALITGLSGLITARMYQHALASSQNMFLRFPTSFKMQLW